MSYDVYVGPLSFNMTSNVGKVFYDHIPQVRSRGGIHELDGLTGRQAALGIGDAFCALEATRMKLWRIHDIGEPAFCALYDAENGWGSLVGAITWLGVIWDACQRHPRSRVRVSA